MPTTPPPDTALPVEALRAHWVQLGEQLQRGSQSWSAEGEKLLRHWGRWPRAYHSTPHLQACLLHLKRLETERPNALEDANAVALALWFHDAIYWPWKTNNEARSAQWASRFLRAQGLPEQQVAAVHQHIMDTRHQPGALTGDALWVVDIDLAILGQPDAVYRKFEQAVRQEYRFVPWGKYVAGRSAVLQGFQNRDRIYETDHFALRLESQARINLAMALNALSNNHRF
jgi:predicted metal-dependent HD superfamily phosphohydrolase